MCSLMIKIWRPNYDILINSFNIIYNLTYSRARPDQMGIVQANANVGASGGSTPTMLRERVRCGVSRRGVKWWAIILRDMRRARAGNLMLHTRVCKCSSVSIELTLTRIIILNALTKDERRNRPCSACSFFFCLNTYKYKTNYIR